MPSLQPRSPAATPGVIAAWVLEDVMGSGGRYTWQLVVCPAPFPVYVNYSCSWASCSKPASNLRTRRPPIRRLPAPVAHAEHQSFIIQSAVLIRFVSFAYLAGPAACALLVANDDHVGRRRVWSYMVSFRNLMASLWFHLQRSRQVGARRHRP